MLWTAGIPPRRAFGPARGTLTYPDGSSAGKGFMKLIGVDCGWFRPPLAPLYRAQLKAREKELETIGFFDFCSKP